VALKAGAVGRLGVRTAATLGAQHVGKGRFGHSAILPDGKAPAIRSRPPPVRGAAGCKADYDGGCFVMTLARMPDILTLTMNPALDISTAIDRVEPVHKLRCGPHQTHPGGGGINMARVLHRLGSRVRAIYTAGGPLGRELSALLDAERVPS